MLPSVLTSHVTRTGRCVKIETAAELSDLVLLVGQGGGSQ